MIGWVCVIDWAPYQSSVECVNPVWILLRISGQEVKIRQFLWRKIGGWIQIIWANIATPFRYPDLDFNQLIFTFVLFLRGWMSGTYFIWSCLKLCPPCLNYQEMDIFFEKWKWIESNMCPFLSHFFVPLSGMLEAWYRLPPLSWKYLALHLV